ncbi:MAG: YitT family protein [Wujia sp.]
MKRFYNSESIIIQYLIIIFGTFLMAVAVVVFFDAMEVVVGGVTGVAIILKSLWGIPMWVVNAAINIPLFVMGYRVLDRRTFIRTLAATIFLTVFLAVIPDIKILTGDMLVDIIIGSVLMGAGLGLIFMEYSSSGGSDLLATLINVRVHHISIPKIMGIIDGIIVIAGAGVFGITSGIYSLIAIYVVTRISDSIVEGPNHAKMMYIVSERNDLVIRYIMEDLDRGASYIEIKGAYTGNSKKMIFCVVSSKEMVKIKQKVYRTDENAICFVGDIREAFGEGFTKFRG